MHVLQPFTDLPYKQHRVQLCEVVVLVNDSVKQLPSFHTTTQRETLLQPVRVCRGSFCIVTDTHKLTIP